MDIESYLDKLSLNNSCKICKKYRSDNICNKCSTKIQFLYDGWDVRCVLCQFYSDYKYEENFCEYCKSN